MTDKAYFAKNWLMRTDELEEMRIRQASKVMLIESKVNNCVSHYETSGRRDAISAQASREDLLADYATEREKLEVITKQVLHEDNITIEVVDLISSCYYRALLLNVHLNRSTIHEIAKSGKYEHKKAQLYCDYNKALDALGEILESRKPPEKIPTETNEKAPIVILSEAPA